MNLFGSSGLRGGFRRWARVALLRGRTNASAPTQAGAMNLFGSSGLRGGFRRWARVALLRGADECVRPYTSRGNESVFAARFMLLFGTGLTLLLRTGRGLR